MFSVSYITKIKADRESLYEFLRNPEKISLWSSSVKRVDVLSMSENVEGASYLLVIDSKLQRNEDLLIQELHPYERIIFEVNGDIYSYKMTYELREDGEDTAVKNIIEVSAKGPKKLIVRKFKEEIEEGFKQSLLEVKRYADKNAKFL